jgi:hypothetical protein
MSIKIKRGGAYVDPTSIKIKRGGAYVNPLSIKIKRGGVYQSVLDSNPYKFVGNRTRPSTQPAAVGANLEHINWIYLGFLPFAPSAFNAAYGMHYTTALNVETAIGNTITFRGWGLAYSATKDVNTATRVRGKVQNGADNIVLDPAVNSVGILTDDLGAAGDFPANRHWWLLTAFAVPSGGSMPGNYDFKGGLSLEGLSASASTPQDSKITTGVLPTLGAGGSAGNWGPVYVTCKGNTGRVGLGWGDSISWGANETSYQYTDGKFGLLSRGMAMGTEMFCANMCVPGTSLGYWVDNGRPGVSKKLDLIKLVMDRNGGKRPFDFMISCHGTNGFGSGGTGIANTTTKTKAYAANARAEWGADLPIHQKTMIARGSSTSDQLQTLAGQTMAAQYQAGGDYWQWNDKLIADRMDGVFNSVINDYAVFGDPSDRTKLHLNTFRANLAVDYVANAGTIILDALPPDDIAICLDPSNAGTTAGAGRVINGTPVDNGNGTWTVKVTFGWNFARTAGTLVSGMDYSDIVHPCSNLHKLGAVIIDACKPNF